VESPPLLACVLRMRPPPSCPRLQPLVVNSSSPLCFGKGTYDTSLSRVCMMHNLQKTSRRRQQTRCPSSHESTGSSYSPRRRRRDPAHCRRCLPQPTDPVCAALAPLLPNPSLPPSVFPSLALSLPPGGGGRHGAARVAPPHSASTHCRIHGFETGAGGRRTAVDDTGGGRGRGGEKAAPLLGRRGGRWCELRHATT
jgi:hypothetical protein